MHAIFEGEDGKHYFHVKAANGEIIAQSEGYASASNAERGYQALLRAVASDVLRDHSQDIGADACVQIGEHAFAAGFAAAHGVAPDDLDSAATLNCDIAWSRYDPPEQLKGLRVLDVAGEPEPAGVAEAVANLSVAQAAVDTDKRRGRR